MTFLGNPHFILQISYAMCGSNFYGSDVNSGFHVVKLELEIGLTWFISLIHKSSVACKQKVV